MELLPLYLLITVFLLQTFSQDLIQLDTSSYPSLENEEELPREGRDVNNIVPRAAKDAPKKADKKSEAEGGKQKGKKKPGDEKEGNNNETEKLTMEEIIQNLIQEVEETKANVSANQVATDTYKPYAADNAVKTQQDAQDAQEMGNKFYNKVEGINTKAKEIMVTGFDTLQRVLQMESIRVSKFLGGQKSQFILNVWQKLIPMEQLKRIYIQNQGANMTKAKMLFYKKLNDINKPTQVIYARVKEFKDAVDKQTKVLQKLKTINKNNYKSVVQEFVAANTNPNIIAQVSNGLSQMIPSIPIWMQQDFTQVPVGDLVIPQTSAKTDPEKIDKEIKNVIHEAYQYGPNTIKNAYQTQLDESFMNVLHYLQQEVNDSKKRWKPWDEYLENREKKQNLPRSFVVQESLVDNVTNTTNQVNRLIPKILRVKVKILTLMLFVLTVLVFGLGTGAFTAYGLTKLWKSVNDKKMMRLKADAGNRHWEFCDHYY